MLTVEMFEKRLEIFAYGFTAWPLAYAVSIERMAVRMLLVGQTFPLGVWAESCPLVEACGFIIKEVLEGAEEETHVVVRSKLL